MKTRMLPIKKVFAKLPRMVRDLSQKLSKQVRLELHGEETELDKSVADEIGDPLVHLVRNAIDHGIETPSERQLRGSPARALCASWPVRKATASSSASRTMDAGSL